METNEFNKRFTGHLEAMLLTARSVLRSDDEANDVVQDAYVRLTGRFGQWRGTGSFRAWLCTVTRRMAIDRRRGRRRLDPERLRGIAAAEDPQHRALVGEETERLQKAIDRLAPAARETVRLRYFAGLRLEEIAAVRGTAVGTIKATLHQSIERLRRELKRRDDV